jgi:hypothetical protein
VLSENTSECSEPQRIIAQEMNLPLSSWFELEKGRCSVTQEAAGSSPVAPATLRSEELPHTLVSDVEGHPGRLETTDEHSSSGRLPKSKRWNRLPWTKCIRCRKQNFTISKSAASRSDGSLRNQVGKYKSIALDHFSRAHRDGAREYRCIIYERVKFSVLPAWIDSRRQCLQQL